MARSRAARFVGISIGLSLFLGIVAAGHWYIADRLVLDPSWGPGWTAFGIAAIVFFFALLVAQPIADRRLPRRQSRWIAWPASLWMGFAFLAIVFLGFSDFLLAIVRAVTGALGETGVLEPGDALARARALAVGLATLGVGAYAVFEGLSFPRVRRVEISLARWPRERDGLRIVQITDIHIGALRGREFAAELVHSVNALDADVVAVTGDLVDGSVEHLADEVVPFAGLRAREGVFFVTGNHDHYSGAEAWADRVCKLGLTVLRNENRCLGDGPGAFAIAGVDDHRGSILGDGGGEDLESALDGIPSERAVVLLAHDPATFKAASRQRVDLQISGHTHAGQLWPFRYLVRLATPYVDGLHGRDGSLLYVSRGTGFWGPPMRLGSPAEITELVLRSGAAVAERG